MASFNVHLSVGVAASGAAATAALVSGVAGEEEVLLFFVLGTVGSLLPDIDADSSAPVQVAFSFLSVLIAFLLMFSLSAVFASVAELFVVWSLGYLLVRFLVFEVFTRFTAHRGIFHSLPAALFFGCLTAAAGHRAFGLEALTAWLCGVFVSFGYLVHLLLDELYSVNLFGMRTKRSLGTAFKLWSSSLAASVYMYAVMAGAYAAAPPVDPLLALARDVATYAELRERLFPDGAWFLPRRALAAARSDP
jgi:hypothetical protein